MTTIGLGASSGRRPAPAAPSDHTALAVTPGSHRTPDGGLQPLYAWGLIGVYGLAIIAVASGIAGESTASAMLVSSVVVVSVGVRLNRPTLAWPIWGFVLAGVFWALAAVAREATDSIGDLSADRSMLPDLLALPGYGAYAVALSAMIRVRDGRNRGALIDALVVGIAAFLLAWKFLIAETLSTSGVSSVAQTSIILYPAIDCAMIALACRLAFTSTNRLPVHRFMLVAMLGLFVGDASYVVDELAILPLGARRELGYMIAAATIGAACLHPSSRFIHLAGTTQRRALPTARAALLAVSLLLPSMLFIYGVDAESVRAVPFQIGVIALALIATFRLLDSVRMQNATTETLRWQAGHDGLTRLPNRSAIISRLDKQLRDRSADVVIAYFDLDHFKNINDALGHAYGDQLLIAVAERLRQRLPADVLLGRIGGDEFVAICDHRLVDTDTLALEISAALAPTFHISGFELSTTASIGITVSHGNRDANALLRDADTAMYRAKDAGRNTHAVFSDDMRTEVERRMHVERQLRETLESGDELCAWFQPIHDFGTGTVIGFEALARWVTPSRTVPPSEFIDVAEDTGLITKLGEVILDQACAAIADVRAATGRDLFVTVNVSARQLVDDSIVRVVADALHRHQLPGAALCLEITESILINDQNVERLRTLRRLGVWLAVDDFGTGYSSLSYLHRMPISKVKIDKAFIDDIADGDPSIMVAILSMAHSLGLACVAEGVETAQQASRLDDLGCDHAQGYFWSRPIPADMIMHVLGHPAAVA
jgi:diguanylate cyclase (GGDEF)-like protein